MPYLKVQTNQTVDSETNFLKELSAKIAEKIGKPESYVMTALEADLKMTFAGSTEKAAFIELKSIGLKKSMTTELSQFICQFIEEKLNVDQSRIYINFEDVPRPMWGWDGSTF